MPYDRLKFNIPNTPAANFYNVKFQKTVKNATLQE